MSDEPKKEEPKPAPLPPTLSELAKMMVDQDTATKSELREIREALARLTPQERKAVEELKAKAEEKKEVEVEVKKETSTKKGWDKDGWLI